MMRIALVILEVLTGIGALAAGVAALAGLLRAPRRPGSPRWFKARGLPGSVLLLVIGGSMLVASGLLLSGGPLGRLVSLEAGIVLLGWVVAHLAMPGYSRVLQPLGLVLGLAVVALSLILPSPG